MHRDLLVFLQGEQNLHSCWVQTSLAEFSGLLDLVVRIGSVVEDKDGDDARRHHLVSIRVLVLLVDHDALLGHSLLAN